MKVTADIKINLKTAECIKISTDAGRAAMRDIVAKIHNQAVRDSPVLTGNNRRSLAFEVSGLTQGERVVDPNAIEGAVYSTSGYGGYLETGTKKMAARPYIKPAVDAEFTADKFANAMKRYLP